MSEQIRHSFHYRTSVWFAALALLASACAPSRNQAPLVPKGLSPDKHVAPFKPVAPTLRSDVLQALPQAERQVGKGEDRCELGVMQFETPEISYSPTEQTLRFRAKAVVHGATYELDLFGKAGDDGTAALLPVKKDQAVKFRARAVCMGVENDTFVCTSLFVDVYARAEGGKCLTEQFLLETVQTPARQPEPQEELPPITENDAEEFGQEAGPQQLEHAESMPARDGRFVGFPKQVDELFKIESPDEWMDPTTIEQHEAESRPDKTPSDGATVAPVQPPATVPTKQKGQPKPAPSRPAATASPASKAVDKEQAGFLQRLWDQITDNDAKKPGARPNAAGSQTILAGERKNDKATANPHQPPAKPKAAEPQPVPAPAPAAPAAPAAPLKEKVQTPPKNEPSKDAKTDAATAWETRENVTSRVQAVGCYGPGIRDVNRPTLPCRGGQLINASSLHLDAEHFQVMWPARKGHYATELMVSFIDRLAKLIWEIIPGYRLQVGDVSRQKGGKFGTHSSHQNGLDADFGFLVKRPLPTKFVNVISPKGALDPSRAFVAEQWTVFKRVVSTGLVSRIFVNGVIKNGFCAYAKTTGESQTEKETLRRINKESGHTSHWHLRLKCPQNEENARCRDEVPPPDMSGCPNTK